MKSSGSREIPSCRTRMLVEAAPPVARRAPSSSKSLGVSATTPLMQNDFYVKKRHNDLCSASMQDFKMERKRYVNSQTSSAGKASYCPLTCISWFPACDAGRV